jgi:hypothetical protein
MTKIDTFESVFKSADKPVYAYGRVEIARMLVVTDLTDAEAAPLIRQVRTLRIRTGATSAAQTSQPSAISWNKSRARSPTSS